MHWHVRVVDPAVPQLLVGHGVEVQTGAYVVQGHPHVCIVHGCCEVGGEPVHRYWLLAANPFEPVQVTGRDWTPLPQVTEHAPQLADVYW
jgi:hypothetical protein